MSLHPTFQTILDGAVRANAVHELTPARYEVTNTRTGKVTSYKTSAAARRAMDRADASYGASCTVRRAIWSDQV